MHRTSPTSGKRSSAEPGLDCHRADPHYTIAEPSGAYGWATACQADEWWETNGTYQLENSCSRFLTHLPHALLVENFLDSQELDDSNRSLVECGAFLLGVIRVDHATE